MPQPPKSGKITNEGNQVKPLVLKAHFDGKQILLDEPYPLTPNATLTVTVLTNEVGNQPTDRWDLLSRSGLNRAYGETEPDYPLSMVKESNPDYEGS